MAMAESPSSGNSTTIPILVSSSPTREIGIDPRCRIVVVSSSRETARAFVERVISMSNDMHSKTTESTIFKENRDEEDEVIPHTLRNRYYEADVWFWVVGVERLKRELGQGEDEGGFGKFDAGDGAFSSDEEEEEEETTDRHSSMTEAPAIVYVWDDEHGMERCRREIGSVVRGMKRGGWHGEEGAEVCLAVRMGGGGEEEYGDVDGMFLEHGFEYVDGRETAGDDEDVPRLPRVLDALSTVMWASMKSKRRGKSKEQSEGMMSELMDMAVRGTGEEEEEFGEMVASPVDVDMLSPFGVGQQGVRRKVSMGFEDDFVEFGGYVALDEDEKGLIGDEDEGMPTKEEIEETASRLFGGEGDLSSVFLSLQGIKGEIAAMENEREKRRMAARVALGLAYGLDVE